VCGTPSEVNPKNHLVVGANGNLPSHALHPLDDALLENGTFYLDHPTPEKGIGREREGLQNILDYRTAPETGQTKVAGIIPKYGAY
jgi:hypothetical protein